MLKQKNDMAVLKSTKLAVAELFKNNSVVRDVQHRKMSKAHRGIKTKYYFFGNGEPINLAFV